MFGILRNERANGFALTELMSVFGVLTLTFMLAQKSFVWTNNVRAKVSAKVSYVEYEDVYRYKTRMDLKQFLFSDLESCADIGQADAKPNLPNFLRPSESPAKLAGLEINPTKFPELVKLSKQSAYQYFRPTCNASVGASSTSPVVGESSTFFRTCISLQPTARTTANFLSKTQPIYGASTVAFHDSGTSTAISCSDFLTNRNSDPHSVYALITYDLFLIDSKNQYGAIYSGVDVVTNISSAQPSGIPGGGSTGGPSGTDPSPSPGGGGGIIDPEPSYGCGLASDMSFSTDSTIAMVTNAGLCRTGNTVKGGVARSGVSPDESWNWQCPSENAADVACEAPITATAPSVTLEASRRAKPGESIFVYWTSKNADECQVTPGNYSGTSGTEFTTVNQDTEYVAICRNTATNETAIARAFVDVYGPLTVDLKVNGQDGRLFLPNGSSVTVTWTSENAESCTVDPLGATELNNTTGTSHKLDRRLTTFNIECTGANNQVESEYINVYHEPEFDPWAKIQVNGDDGYPYVSYGSNVSITWQSNDVESCTIVDSSNRVISNDLNHSGFSFYFTKPEVFSIECTPKGERTLGVGDVISVCPVGMPDTDADMCTVKFYNSSRHTSNPDGWTELGKPETVPVKLTDYLYSSYYGLEVDYFNFIASHRNSVSWICVYYKEGRASWADADLHQGYALDAWDRGCSETVGCTKDQLIRINYRHRAKRAAPKIVFPPSYSLVRSQTYTFQIMTTSGRATTCSNEVTINSNVSER